VRRLDEAQPQGSGRWDAVPACCPSRAHMVGMLADPTFRVPDLCEHALAELEADRAYWAAMRRGSG
jgi:hypothetical protein